MLDLYVMPLSRYLAGTFEEIPPAAGSERLNQRATIPLEEAVERAAAIRAALAEAVGTEVDWPDEGEVALAKRLPQRMLHGLRSLAAHHEYPPKLLLFRRAFGLREDPREHPSLRRIYQGEDTEFPHLMRHSDNRGFWFPVDFAQPGESNEPAWWRIGSAPRLGQELESVGRLIEKLAPERDREELERVHQELVNAIESACARRLPLIIEG
jgi:hypothetical protein